MIVEVSSAEKIPNLWFDKLFPLGAPTDNAQDMLCWKAGDYYKSCGHLNEEGMLKTANPINEFRIDYKVPPGTASLGRRNKFKRQLHYKQAELDHHFECMLVEMKHFMTNGRINVLHLDYVLDNVRELQVMEHVMQFSTNQCYLEIQYPKENTKPMLDYTLLENSWQSIAIRYGHGPLGIGENLYGKN
tara:strand:- start:118 stop:681 length:564 start_codon:yes stop_codon:yes gene_type:complete